MKRVHNRSKVFLAAYRATCSITKAAEAADMEKTMHYRWLKEDQDYAREFAIAHDEAIQTLEDEAIRRAHEGIAKPLVYQGQFMYASYHKNGKGIGPPLAIQEYSDSLLMFLLRGARPAKYRERFQHEVTGSLNVTRYKGTLQDLLATYRELTQQASEE